MVNEKERMCKYVLWTFHLTTEFQKCIKIIIIIFFLQKNKQKVNERFFYEENNFLTAFSCFKIVKLVTNEIFLKLSFKSFNLKTVSSIS